MTVCVLGLGYIGLPTAAILAANGCNVLGVDVNPVVVDTINQGNIHIEEPGLEALVKEAVTSGDLRASLTPETADAYIIAVPTPITEEKRADLSYIDVAARSILPLLKSGDLVILESTSPPGTTRERLLPLLEKSGLKAGVNLFVAHCPERVLPGRIIYELVENHRVIGGIDPRSAMRARELYETFVQGNIYLTDATTAEMVKVMENTYRDVNIALANELAQLCHDLDINAWDVIHLANMHPRVNLHSPGPGVGGHCISVDPWFLVERFPRKAQLIRQAREVNDGMPRYVYRKLMEATQHIANPKVTVLGMTYKANVDDIREAPSLKLLELLEQDPHMQVATYDPFAKAFPNAASELREAVVDSDCLLLMVDHDAFVRMNPETVGSWMRHRVVMDTRNALNPKAWQAHGFDYIRLGEGVGSQAMAFEAAPLLVRS